MNAHSKTVGVIVAGASAGVFMAFASMASVVVYASIEDQSLTRLPLGLLAALGASFGMPGMIGGVVGAIFGLTVGRMYASRQSRYGLGLAADIAFAALFGLIGALIAFAGSRSDPVLSALLTFVATFGGGLLAAVIYRRLLDMDLSLKFRT